MHNYTPTDDRRTRRREHLVLLVLTVLIILGPARQFSGELIKRDADKIAVRNSFEETLGDAMRTYQFRSTAQSHKTRRQQELEASKEELQSVMEEKTQVRERIEALQEILKLLQESSAAPTAGTGSLEERLERFRAVARETSPAFTDIRSDATPRSALARALRGENALEAVHQPVVALDRLRGERRELRQFLVTRVSADTLSYLHARHLALLTEAGEAIVSVDKAQKAVARSEAEIRQILAITKDVHDQVLRLQGEMARIDARLKEKAERALIEKGLLPPQRKSGGDAIVASAPELQWPVRGGISAGFLDASYKKFFGVPHYGIDIVVGEFTPVRAAAEGVVFLVRDGGETGYTYVLIGHRGGLATLYGHLEIVNVATGQDVNAGQVIGLTGAPGKPGAGPMMTGPHLHFEVIQNGTNVDPRSILP